MLSPSIIGISKGKEEIQEMREGLTAQVFGKIKSHKLYIQENQTTKTIVLEGGQAWWFNGLSYPLGHQHSRRFQFSFLLICPAGRKGTSCASPPRWETRSSSNFRALVSPSFGWKCFSYRFSLFWLRLNENGFPWSTYTPPSPPVTLPLK